MTPESRKQFETPEVANYLKDVEQGAATTVWAAIGKEWEGKGGKYLENVSVSQPYKEGGGRKGYNPWAYDEQGAAQLWDLSAQLVGHGI